MAGEDNGALITKFDEVFNGYIDHEVIKAVLQYCQWDPEQALQSLLGMVEVPESVLVRALSISTTIFEGTTNSSYLSKESEEQQISNSVLHSTNGSQPISDTQDSVHEEDASPGWSVWPGLSSSLTRNHSCIPAVKASAATFKWSGINQVPPPSSTSYPGSHGIKELTDTRESDGGNVKKSTISSCIGPDSQFGEYGSSGRTFSSALLTQQRHEAASPLHRLSGTAEEGYPSSTLCYTPPNNTSSPIKGLGRTVSKKDEIRNKIILGDKLLVLMRGLPGSGKSTLAREIKGRNGVVLSTDDFHCDKHGNYNYKPSKLSEAHTWNKNRALKHLRNGKTPIIIDNTNLQVWEMTPYIRMALEHGYEVDILESGTSWSLNSAELAKRNIHNVPKAKIKEMKERYQKDVKIEDLISQLRLSSLEESNTSSSNSESHAESFKLSGTKEGNEVLAKHKPATGLSVIKHYMRVNSAFYESENKEEDDYEDDVVIESSEEEEEEENLLSFGTFKEKDVHQQFEVKEDVLVDRQFEEGHGDNEKLHSEDVVLKNAHVEHFKSSGVTGNTVGEDSCAGEADQKDGVEEKKTHMPSVSQEQRSIWDGIVEQDEEGKRDDCEQVPQENQVQSVVQQPGRIDSVEGVSQQVFYMNSGCRKEPPMSPVLLCSDLSSMISKAANAYESNGEEWKDVPSDASPTAQLGIIEDADFSDLVQTFSKALRFQLGTEIDEVSVSKKDDGVSDDLGDAAMYSLISDMEDKLGRPISSLIARPSGKGEELQLLNFKESGQNMISGNDSSHQEDHEPSIVEPSTSESQLSGDGVGINTSIDEDEFSEKIKDHNTEVSMDSSCSWGCLETQATVAATWEGEKQLSTDSNTKPQPSRTSRRKEGDKLQWLKVEKSSTEKEVADDEVSLWEPVLNAETAWDQDANKLEETTTFSKPSPPMERERQLTTPPPQSGAVPKRKSTTSIPCTSYSPTKELSPADSGTQVKQDRTSNEVIDQEWNMPQFPQADLPEIPKQTEKHVSVSDMGTQTVSQDFQTLAADSNVYRNKIIYANVGGLVMDDVTNDLSQDGPLTKHKLRLDKSTMTVADYTVVEVKSLQNLTAFFPSIPEDHLKDVLEKCRYDLDWAMNLLLDGGYEMADSVPDLEKEVVEDDDWKDSNPDLSESFGTGSTGDEKTSSAECSDLSNELLEHRGKKLKQSQRPELLASKRAIEETVTVASKLDDRGNRLTGGQCNKKYRSRSKQRNKAREKITISAGTEKEQHLKDNGDIDSRDESGLISLTIDPLFASQLVNLFGPIGPYKMNNLTEDDYNVILPVSLCRQVYQLWGKTLEGKFHHESEVLDSYILDDQQLAEQLQAEENARLGKRRAQEEGDIAFQMDPPKSFKEIMELEQALLESRKRGKGSNSDSNLSHRLNILRLQEEYSHLDPSAIEKEFKECNYNYKDTLELIQDKYGSEGHPKTVVAPEAMYHFEQEMLEKAKALSLKDAEEQQKLEQEEFSYEVDDPQVYREEAIAHYQQRQKALRKAQEASRQGMKAVAAYYAQIGNLHATRLREANKRASEKILEAVNSTQDGNTLDLHYLHVTEAVSVTQAFLSERQRLLRARNQSTMHVSLITGRGANSQGGVARIKPAVKEFLQKKWILPCGCQQWNGRGHTQTVDWYLYNSDVKGCD